jgi:type IV secretory pathway VirJ component
VKLALLFALSALVFGRFGSVEVVQPAAPSGEVAVLIAGAKRAELAQALASRGALVFAFDPTPYLAALESSKEPCAYPAGELEGLSHFAQQELARPDYTVPLLVGEGAGVAIVEAALAQAPTNTFRGAVALDRTSPLPKAACGVRGPVSLRAKRNVAEVADSFAALAAQTSPEPVALHADVSGLPLVELPAEGKPGDTLAVLLTGDGGWAGLDRHLGAALAARGIPVVGWNSLRYFWTARTPDAAAADLARVLRHYLAAWHAKRAVLIGYSFGADVMPFLASRLPPELRARVALVALLGPAETAQFEFHFGNWLGVTDPPGAQPLAPEIAKLGDLRVLCVYGREESDSLCPKLDPKRVALDARSGGHHFDGDYQALSARIVAEIE